MSGVRRGARDDSPIAGLPSSFGRYSVEREVGRGGMARVFEGRHCELKKRVAIKVLLRTDDPSAVARFVSEGRAAAQIAHPNVVNVIDVGLEDEVPYLVMDFIEGVPLTRYLEHVRRMSVEETADTLVPILSATQAAHDLGTVHRDLKPGNIMLRRPLHGETAPIPVVLDFGISKQMREVEVVDADPSLLTSSRAVLGTIPYLAPELTSGARFASPRSDQYALGVVLYECLTGFRPFAGQGVYETMHAIVTARLMPPRERVATIPAAVEAIVLRALQRAPADRYTSVRELGAELLPFASPRVREAWRGEFSPSADHRRHEPASPAVTDEDVPPLREGTIRSLLSAPAANRRRRRQRAGAVAMVVVGVLLTAGVITFGAPRGTGQRGSVTASAEGPSSQPAKPAPFSSSGALAGSMTASPGVADVPAPTPAVPSANATALPWPPAQEPVRRPIARSPAPSALFSTPRGTHDVPIVE